MDNDSETRGPGKIRVFFYGSFMSAEVLAQAGCRLDTWAIARLDGFDIALRPLATLIPSDEHTVYGLMTTATHAELARLYGQDWVRAYLPEAVVVKTRDGALHPALCYIAAAPTAQPPFGDYVDRIIEFARRTGLPDWYLRRLERLK